MKRNDETSELYYTTVLGGETYKIGAENILHLKGPVFGELLGKSIVKEGAEALSLAMTQNNHASNYFKNASVPSGIIEYSGELEDVSVENLRSSWKSLYGGENSNSVAVLEYGMTFRPLGVNPHDSQLLESRKFQLSEIARLFRIPPHMIGELDRSIKANITQQALEFVQHTMLPWIRRWEERLWLDCLRGSDKSEYFFKFNLNGFLRGDPESRAKFYREMLDLGVFSVNKVLELEDQNKIGPEGDIRLVALNRANLEEFLTTDKTSQKVRV